MTTATPAKPSDPYKDLSPEARERVERALAKAKTAAPPTDAPEPEPAPKKAVKKTPGAATEGLGSLLPQTGGKAKKAPAKKTADNTPAEVVDGVPEPEVSGELVESRLEPVRRSRQAKADLRKATTKYQVCEPLAADDMSALRNSVLRYGIHMPIIIDQNGDVIDGHHRMHLAVDNDLPFYTVTVHLESDEERRALAWELNRARRQMSAEQKAEIRWQKVVVEGRPIAEVAKELGESHDTTLRNVRKQAEKNVADADSADAPGVSNGEVLTPSEQQRQKVVDALTANPKKSDHQIAKETGASQPTVSRTRKKMGAAANTKDEVIKNKTAPKPTIHDEFFKALGKLDKTVVELTKVADDPRTKRSAAKIWEVNGQKMVAILNGLNAIADKLQA